MGSQRPSRRDVAGLALSALGLLLPGAAQAAEIVPSTTRVCATCAFWKGPRMPSLDRRSVIVASGAKGQCLNPQSPLAGLTTRPEQGTPEAWRRAPGLV